MRITCRSSITHKIHQMEINVSKEELLDWINSGRLIQKALYKLSADDREFLISGTPPKDYDTIGAAWEICEHIPDEIDSIIFTLDKEEISAVLECIKKYSP